MASLPWQRPHTNKGRARDFLSCSASVIYSILNKNMLKKIASIIIIYTFLASGLVYPEVSNIFIPEEIGRVTEVYEAPITSQQGQGRFVVHIQDLHTNSEGSFNLARILD